MTTSFPRCPREDCTHPGVHWHNLSERVSAHVPSAPPIPAPVPVAVVIPEATIEDLQRARVHLPASTALSSGGLAQLLEADRAYLRDLLDVWVPVPDGHTIPTGTLTRREYDYGIAAESPYQPLPPVEGVLLLVRVSDLDKLIPPVPEPDPTEVMEEAVARELSADMPFDDLDKPSWGFWLGEARRVLGVVERAGFTVEPKPREDGAQ